MKKFIALAAFLLASVPAIAADTTTTNYGLVKPEIGASNDSWGTKVNSNLDILDSAIGTISGIANAAMPKAGGTFTGNVNFFLSNFGPQTSGGNPYLYWDAGDAITYDRANDGYYFLIGGSNKSFIGPSSSTSFVPLNVVGALTQSGNQVWHAGNFNPAAYAPLAGAAFTGAVSAPSLLARSGLITASAPSGEGGQIVLGFANVAATGQQDNTWNIDVDGSNNLRIFNQRPTSTITNIFSANPATAVVGFSQRPTFSGATPWDSGNFNPAAKQDALGYTPANKAGDTFTGGIVAPSLTIDGTFYLLKSGSDPAIVFDTNDFLQYSRASNKYLFYIGGNVVASIDASGNLKVAGNVTANTTP